MQLYKNKLSGIRYLLIIVIVLLLVLMFVSALSIPFYFESPSMWYKFGWEKTSLRTGKVIGIAAALLVLLQLPLVGRLKILGCIFSLPGLIRQHRINARVIVSLAMIHPACVLFSGGTIIIPLEIRYWPEWVGVGLLITLLIQFICSQWRLPLKISFHNWQRFHRITGTLIMILLMVHVLYVSESFTWPGLPRLSVLIAAIVFFMIWLWVHTGWMRALIFKKGIR